MKSFFKNQQLLIPVIIFFMSGVHAQDIHFSQFSMTPLLLNPAMAGANYEMEAILNYKAQWTGVVNYKTFNASYDMRMGHKKGKNGFWGMGVNLFTDKAGDGKIGTTYGNINIAYHTFLNNTSMLGGGLYGGFGQRSVGDYNALTWGSQYDAGAYNSTLPDGEPAPAQNFSFPDLGAGLVYTYKSKERYSTANDQMLINIGGAAFHATQPKFSFYDSGSEKLYMKYTFFANALIGLGNTKQSLMPGFFYTRQGPTQEIFLGTYLRFLLQEESKITGFKKGSAFSLGGFYRTADAFVVAGQIEFSYYTVGLSYDVNTSRLKDATNGKGGFEISLRFVQPNPFAAAKSRI